MELITKIPSGRLLLQKLGIVGFWFFFLKGCLWLVSLGLAVIWAAG